MEIDENGVVNPLRPPAVVRETVRSIRSMPPVALAFLVLAGVDLGAHVVESRAVTPAVVARAVTVLFPAALLWRRPDAAIVTPLLFRGVILLAIAEIAATAIRFASSVIPADDAFLNDPGSDLPRLTAGAAVSVVVVVGWALVGVALAGLRPTRGVIVRVLAGLVAGCAVAVGAGSVFLGFGTASGTGPGTLVVFGLIEAASWIVTAFVGWVLVSRAGGLPRRATIAAAAGVAIQTIAALPVVVIALAILATRAEDAIALQWAGFTIFSFATVLPPFLYAFAFATGLGDPPPQPHDSEPVHA